MNFDQVVSDNNKRLKNSKPRIIKLSIEAKAEELRNGGISDATIMRGLKKNSGNA